MKQRKHLPNIIAVDFYKVGDLMGVVRTLNGLGPPDRSLAATLRRKGRAHDVTRLLQDLVAGAPSPLKLSA